MSGCVWRDFTRFQNSGNLEYDEFLRQHRVLMAGMIRRAYEKLSDIDPKVETTDPSAEERVAWELIKDVEIRLRQLVAARYHSRWDARTEAQTRKHLGEEAWKTIERNREKHAAQYGRASSDQVGVLQYTYLGQLVQLMVAADAWKLFKPMFRDRRELEDLVRKISGVRNDAAHFRAVPLRQLRACQVACDELKALLLAGEASEPGR